MDFLNVFEKERVCSERNPEGLSFPWWENKANDFFSNLMHCEGKKINNKPEKLFLFKQKARLLL